jgi:hypothetical protein
MATFLSSTLALTLLAQASPAPASPPAAAAEPTAEARLARDSSDGAAWLALGRGYLDRAAQYHRHAGAPGADSVGVRLTLDSADFALGRAGQALGNAPAGDSARALQVSSRGARGLLAWEAAGVDAAAVVWAAGAADGRLPSLLEELGENLLRACPRGGALLTAGPVDTEAAWFMHFARGLRRDLVVVPLELWRSDSVFRGRVTADLRVPPPRGDGEYPWLRSLVEQQPLCVSMGFEQPPAIRRGPGWQTGPLVWVAGPRPGPHPGPAPAIVLASRRDAPQ